MKKGFFLIIALFLVTNVIYSQDCNLNEEGKRHWYKAEGIREAATNESDYQLAKNEYLKALKFAPNCPDIYYNLGACCEEIGKMDIDQFDDAISYFNKYLRLLPNAADKEEVQVRIYKIEGKKDKFHKDKVKPFQEKRALIEGTWYYTDDLYGDMPEIIINVDEQGRIWSKVVIASYIYNDIDAKSQKDNDYENYLDRAYPISLSFKDNSEKDNDYEEYLYWADDDQISLDFKQNFYNLIDCIKYPPNPTYYYEYYDATHRSSKVELRRYLFTFINSNKIIEKIDIMSNYMYKRERVLFRK